MAPLIYLDTHVVAWMFAGRTELIPESVRVLLDEHDLMISPAVKLELQYLFELPQSVPLDASQRELSTDMVRYWTQFARSGEPNSVVTAFWSRYDPTVDEFQSLAPPSPVTEFGFATDHKCDFWDQLFQASSGDQASGVQRAIRKLRIAPRGVFWGQEKGR